MIVEAADLKGKERLIIKKKVGIHMWIYTYIQKERKSGRGKRKR